LATRPGRTDGEVLDAVAIQVAGGDDHAPVELPRLAPRPVPELLPGGAGIDVELPRERPRLVFRRRRRHRDVALAVAVEIRDRRHDPTEAAPAVHSLPVMQLLPAGRGEDPGPTDHRAVRPRGERCADAEIGAPLPVET